MAIKDDLAQNPEGGVKDPELSQLKIEVMFAAQNTKEKVDERLSKYNEQ